MATSLELKKILISKLSPFLLLFLLSGPAGAVNSEPNPGIQSRSAVSTVTPRGVIFVDEATVFSRPDFESPVITTLPFDTQVPASNRIFGEGFRRVRLPSGQLGYINTGEIELRQGGSQPKSALSASPPARTKESQEFPSSRFLKRNLVLGVETLNYTSRVRGSLESAQVEGLSLSVQGAPVWLEGPVPTSISLFASNRPPSFLTEGASGLASGSLIYLGLGLIQPWKQYSFFEVSVPYGVFAKYGSFSWVQNAELKKSSDFSLGLRLGMDVTVPLAKLWALQIGASYLYEKELYHSISGHLQIQF